jgi:hypothetical protein
MYGEISNISNIVAVEEAPQVSKNFGDVGSGTHQARD